MYKCHVRPCGLAGLAGLVGLLFSHTPNVNLVVHHFLKQEI